MRTHSPFRFLLALFQNRFLENDTVSPGEGFHTNLYQVFGILATIGMFVGYSVVPAFLLLSERPPTPQTEWALRSLRLWLPAYSFGVAGFAALFQWDTLFPDRRDFLVLGPFPIRLRDIIAAKFAALLWFLFLLSTAINIVPDVMMALVGLAIPNSRGGGAALILAHFAATGGASVFGFLAVVGLQGILINVTSVAMFRRISPWIQMCGMSLMVLTLLGYPIYSLLFGSAIAKNQMWPYFFPPIWFSGLHELFLGGHDRILASLGMLSINMTALAIVTIAITWGFGFRRHFRRTLETEDAQHRPSAWKIPEWLVRNPRERTLFGFAGKTLARSQKHQFFLAAYLSAGFGVAALVGTAVRDGKLAISPGGVRAVAFVIGFFLVSGFRAAFQFPAELNANWIFRMTEARWTEVSRRATRKLVLAVGLAPLAAIALPLEISSFNWFTVLEHLAVQVMATALLVEVLFWTFDKVPFTCSYFPGRKSIALLVVLYVYGISGYCFHMADLEEAMERSWMTALLFFAASGAALIYSWRRRRVAEAVRFDGSEPVIQTLELT